MFPEDVAEYIENEELIANDTSSTFNGRAFLYDFKKGDFIYKNGAPIEVTGIKALEVWIEKVIRTERFRFKIYEEMEYGVSIEDLIGSMLPRGFIESELKRELTESILLNPFVEELTDWAFEIDGSEWRITFTVVTIDDAFVMEVAA